MKGIYANVLWFIFLIFSLIVTAFQRYTSIEWTEKSDVRMNYDILYGSLAIFLAICVFGLLSKHKWGYSFSVTANATLTMLPLGIFIVSIYLVLPDIGFFELLKINMGNLVVGVVSLCFWVWLVKAKGKLI